MSLREEVIEALIKAHIPSPRLEADIILKHAAPSYPDMSQEERQNALQMLKRRLNHEPMDKILGYREFYKSVFKVSRDVLSPRPDTEILVESALELIAKNEVVKILDLGTGSGCILLSLLKENPQAMGTGVDVSAKALEIAKENAKALNLLSQTTFVNKSWTEPDFITETYDIIVSNPPYIPTEEIATLSTEVKDNDPLSALDGGADGLKCYLEIAEIAPSLLTTGGHILLEIGYNQAEDVIKIFENQGFKLVKAVQDLAQINRCVILKK
ncbi:MAG: peptide chain release factor N(5)-glutamine methyltransferase [Alphaproteobacteria bacterium]|nr:peptide chain release factor N(5)-glutamine methyltransferase [Alphaproteobacteria bacterium]